MYVGSEAGIGVGIKKWMDGLALSEPEQRGSRFFQNPRKAASLVCHALMLNAWRRRRGEVLCLQDTTDDLTEKLKNMHLQIFVLRRLIDTENCRVNRLTGEVQRVKSQFDETTKERDELRTVIFALRSILDRGVEIADAERETFIRIRSFRDTVLADYFTL